MANTQPQAPIVNEAMINMAAEAKIAELKNADPEFDDVASELWNIMENDEYFANTAKITRNQA